MTEWVMGDRVLLIRDVDVYPTIYCHAGETGTIRHVDKTIIMVHMDQHYPELNDWGNELEIWREWHEDALTFENGGILS